MFQLVLTIHLGLCLFLIIVVLLQQGKGADAGAALGGGSNTLFGASGASTVLSRATTMIAVAFIVTSVILVKMYPGVTSSGGAGDVLGGSVMSDQVHPGEDTTKETPAKAVTGEKTEAAPASAGK